MDYLLFLAREELIGELKIGRIELWLCESVGFKVLVFWAF
jgi:hypothetical protein